MRLSSIHAGIITAIFGLIFSIPLAIAGSMIFVSHSPEPPGSITKKDHNGDSFISGSVDYGSRK